MASEETGFRWFDTDALRAEIGLDRAARARKAAAKERQQLNAREKARQRRREQLWGKGTLTFARAVAGVWRYSRDPERRLQKKIQWRSAIVRWAYPPEVARVVRTSRAVGRFSWRITRAAVARVRTYRQQWHRKGYWRSDGVYVRPTTVNRRAPAFRRR